MSKDLETKELIIEGKRFAWYELDDNIIWVRNTSTLSDEVLAAVIAAATGYEYKGIGFLNVDKLTGEFQDSIIDQFVCKKCDYHGNMNWVLCPNCGE